EEGGRGRLETAGDDLLHQVDRKLLVAARQRERNHADAIFVPLQIALPVKGLQRVAGVIFESAEEGRKAELLGISPIEQIADEVERILVQHLLLVIALGDEVIELFPEVMEKDR